MTPATRVAFVVLMVLAGLVVTEASALAHEIGAPHQDVPAPRSRGAGGGDGASPAIVIAGVVTTIVVAVLLGRAKRRAVAADAADARDGAAAAD